MRTFLLIAAVAGLGIVWTIDRRAAAHLHAQVSAARAETAQRDALERENERLRRVHEQAVRASGASVDARPDGVTAAREPIESAPPSRALELGEWRTSNDWKDRGGSTPEAALETVLWAAAGGDLSRLRQLLHFDGSVRASADAIVARLPETARARYSNGEDLVAAFTTQAIPLTEAQLVWQHRPSKDQAVVALFLRNTAETPLPLPLVTAGSSEEKVPLMTEPNGATRTTYLSLRRMDDGSWRLVVPAEAVEKIARQLGNAVTP